MSCRGRFGRSPRGCATAVSIDYRVFVRPVRNANRAIMLLMLSLAALNMPQAVVFCIGHDGHMAIEPAGHQHCQDGSHPRNYHAAGAETAEHAHLGVPQKAACIDIPIPSESSDSRFASQRSRLTPVAAAGLAPSVDTYRAADAPCVLEPLPFPSFAFYDASPRGVILQV